MGNHHSAVEVDVGEEPLIAFEELGFANVLLEFHSMAPLLCAALLDICKRYDYNLRVL